MPSLGEGDAVVDVVVAFVGVVIAIVVVAVTFFSPPCSPPASFPSPPNRAMDRASTLPPPSFAPSDSFPRSFPPPPFLSPPPSRSALTRASRSEAMDSLPTSEPVLFSKDALAPQLPQNFSPRRSRFRHDWHGTRCCRVALADRIAFRVEFRGEKEEDRGLRHEEEYASFPVSTSVRPARASSLLKRLSTSTLHPEGEASFSSLLLPCDANDELEPVSNECLELSVGDGVA